jgi:hypothetical protein
MASPALAASFTKEGIELLGTYGYNYSADRLHLVTDGSFELGCDYFWSCTSTSGCYEWITDLVPLGLWNYDGNYVAWFGGFCLGNPTCFTEICQHLLLDEDSLSWWWMAYVNEGVGLNYVAIDGERVYSHVLQPNEHLVGYQPESADISDYTGQMHEVCFGVDNYAYCHDGYGDNWFVDYVELFGSIATEEMSFSTVKAIY